MQGVVFHCFFRREYGKPMHKPVADFLSAMFGVEYLENDIAKMTAHVAKYVKPEDSADI